MHYSGGAEWFDARGGATRMVPGYAVCCTVDRAYTIRRLKRQTRREHEVTCKGCLRVLAREQDTLDGVVAKVRAALAQRAGTEGAGRMTVNVGVLINQDPGEPPHVAYVTAERDQLVDLARDPDTGAEWSAGGDTRVRAMEALLKLVERVADLPIAPPTPCRERAMPDTERKAIEGVVRAADRLVKTAAEFMPDYPEAMAEPLDELDRARERLDAVYNARPTVGLPLPAVETSTTEGGV
jgi:hypothetical protein